MLKVTYGGWVGPVRSKSKGNSGDRETVPSHYYSLHARAGFAQARWASTVHTSHQQGSVSKADEQVCLSYLHTKLIETSAFVIE